MNISTKAQTHRHLRRLAAFFLCAVLTLGLLPVPAVAAEGDGKYAGLPYVTGYHSAAAMTDFTDKNEASLGMGIEVLSAIGVINGYADGSINPKGSITREEAAKLLTFTFLGPEKAGQLKPRETGFSDVAADRWSAPYIGWLAAEGVINGMGDKTFAPTEKVTGYQFIKMLLSGLGYGANGEFSGTDWTANVLKYATSVNTPLLDKAYPGESLSPPVTREEAFYLTTATLNLNQAEYDKVTGTYALASSLCGKVYPGLVLEFYVLGDQPYKLYTLNNKLISTLVQDPLYELKGFSSGGASLSELLKPSGGKYLNIKNYSAGEIDYSNYYFQNERIKNLMGNTGSAVAEKLEKRGVLTWFWGSDYSRNVFYSAGIIERTVAPVTGDVITGTDGRVTIPGVGSFEKDKVIYAADLKKGDVALFYKSEQSLGLTFVDKAERFTGTLAALNKATGLLTVNGKGYYAAELPRAKAMADYSALVGLKDTVFYGDGHGNLLWFDAVSYENPVWTEPDNTERSTALDHVVFATQPSELDPTGGGAPDKALVEKGGKFWATLLFPDGTTKVVTVSQFWNDSEGAYKPVTAADDVCMGFYTYTVEKDGSYQLTRYANTRQGNVAGVSSGDTTPVEGTLVTGGKVACIDKVPALATNKTLFTYYDDPKFGTQSYTGVANVPSYENDGSVKGSQWISTTSVWWLGDEDGYLLWAVGQGGKFNPLSGDEVVYAFILDGPTVLYNAAGEDFDRYDAIIDGKFTTLDAVHGLGLVEQGGNAVEPSLSTGKLYAITGFRDGLAAAAVTGVAGVAFATWQSGAANVEALASDMGLRLADLNPEVNYQMQRRSIARFALRDGLLTCDYDTGSENNSHFLVAEDARAFVWDDNAKVMVKISLSALDGMTPPDRRTFAISALQVSAADKTLATLFIRSEG